MKGDHIKIYWTKKSIPELTKLSPVQRKRNYREAAKLASTHREYGIGIGIFALLILILSMLFKSSIPDPELRDVLRGCLTILHAAYVFVQFRIYAMRKHYRHILMKTD